LNLSNISVINKYGELESSSSLLHNMPLLREKLQHDGYLFFRGIFHPDRLLEIRKSILQTGLEHGVVNEEAPIMDGIYAGGEIPSVYKFELSPLYRDLLELENFNRFGSDPVLLLLLGGLLEAEVQEHRRRIARITFPGSYRNTTPAHQDYLYIKGTQDTYTCWIPCGDCPEELGGLAVLEGSHRLGFIPHIPMEGTGGQGIEQDLPVLQELKWLSTDFKLGDLLLFHGLTIHRALHNLTKDRLRVSLEYRYQRKGDRIDAASLRSHYIAE